MTDPKQTARDTGQQFCSLMDAGLAGGQPAILRALDGLSKQDLRLLVLAYTSLELDRLRLSATAASN